LVRAIARVDESRAQDLLDSANGRVKVAIVMERRGLNAAQALALLDQHRGSLRALL
jgi:N-acetylmuramic acid 6-phosphate etherase